MGWDTSMFIFENISIPHSQTLRVRRDRSVYKTWTRPRLGCRVKRNPIFRKCFATDFQTRYMCLHTKSFPDIFCWHLLLRKHSARACPWKVKSTILAWCRKTSTMPTLMSSPLGQSFFDVITAIIFVSPSHPSEPTPAIKAPSGNHQMFLKMLITVQSRNLGVSEFPKICLFTWTQRLTLKFYKKSLVSSKKLHILKTCPIALCHKPSLQSNHKKDITQLATCSWKGCLWKCQQQQCIPNIATWPS